MKCEEIRRYHKVKKDMEPAGGDFRRFLWNETIRKG